MIELRIVLAAGALLCASALVSSVWPDLETLLNTAALWVVGGAGLATALYVARHIWLDVMIGRECRLSHRQAVEREMRRPRADR